MVWGLGFRFRVFRPHDIGHGKLLGVVIYFSVYTTIIMVMAMNMPMDAVINIALVVNVMSTTSLTIIRVIISSSFKDKVLAH